jgi:uncharacterized protein YraI
MKRLGIFGLLVAALLTFATLAQAQTAYTAKEARLRAGPARDYPVVALLPAGYPLTVMGCLSDYTWCDVVADSNRGWIYAGNISYSYESTYVPILDYGPTLGIAVFGFVIGDYWGHYYRNKPWYSERRRWEEHPPVRHERPGAWDRTHHRGEPGGPAPRPPRTAPQYPPRHIAPPPAVQRPVQPPESDFQMRRIGPQPVISKPVPPPRGEGQSTRQVPSQNREERRMQERGAVPQRSQSSPYPQHGRGDDGQSEGREMHGPGGR